MLGNLKRPLDQTTYLFTMLAVVLPLISIAASQIFLTLAFLAFLSEKAINKDAGISFPPLKAPLFLFMATTFVAYLFSPEPGIGSPPLRKFVLFVIILLVTNKFCERRLFQTYHALFALGSVGAAFSIYQYLFLSRGSVGARLTGFMGHWMTLSGEMMLVFVGLASYLAFANPKRKILWSLAFAVIGLSIMFTLTRSVWIATAVGLLVLLSMRFRHWKVLVAAGLALVLSGLAAPNAFQERLRSILDTQDPSNYTRFAVWKAGLGMLEEHPWVGVGPQRVAKVFYDYHPTTRDRYRTGFFPVHMHNNLLQFAAERGIPCALAWLWLILRIAVDQWKGFCREQLRTQKKTIYAIGFLSVLVLFLAGLFEFNFGDSEVLMIFLFLVSAPYALGSSVSERRNRYFQRNFNKLSKWCRLAG
jgi:putative inorganic carbon (hco3(-)) transporter